MYCGFAPAAFQSFCWSAESQKDGRGSVRDLSSTFTNLVVVLILVGLV